MDIDKRRFNKNKQAHSKSKVNTNILITTGLNINDYPNKIVRCIESINTNLVLNVDVVINSEYINKKNLINLFQIRGIIHYLKILKI